MNQFYVIIIFIISLITTSCQTKQDPVQNHNSINPIIGDISFIEKFGSIPNKNVNEQLRIATHLEYVEQLLRKKDVSNLPIQLQKNRNRLLDLLHNYWTNYQFPKNHDFKEERKPCFIDQDGNICAVGYLVANSAGIEVAKSINDQFQYHTIHEMESEVLTNWISESGFTKSEIASIQPTYAPPPEYNHISSDIGIPSAILGGANLTLSTLNALQFSKKGKNSYAIPIIGLLSGVSQITLGITSLNNLNEPKIGFYNGRNEAERNLSYFNIGFGTSTVLFSAINLFHNRKKEDKPTSWNMFSYPVNSHQNGFGISMTHLF